MLLVKKVKIVKLKIYIMNLISNRTKFIPSILDDLINFDWNYDRHTFSVPAVNIKELDTHFEIELAIPGKNKNDFEIEIEDGLLSISSSFNKEQKEDNSKLTRIEFDYNSFKRTFSIPESVDSSKIEATYKGGILKISLSKRDEALPEPKKLIKVK